MAKPIQNKTGAKKAQDKNVKKAAVSQAKEPLAGLESFFERNQAKFIIFFLFTSLIFSFFLFDIKISEGGDDSAYIQRGWYFITKHDFPFYQGPLYPLVLSIPLYFYGINLFILKLTSVVFALGNVWFIYLAFRKRIPYLVLFSLLFFLSVNSVIQYYASQTYTESFFLFLQAISVYFLMKVIESMPSAGETDTKKKLNLNRFIWVGVFFTLLSLAKSIAIVCIVPVILFFILYRNYRYALYTLLSFTVFKVIYEFGIRLFYEDQSGQLKQILLKDYYKPELGYEDFSGLLDRFSSNFQHFTSVSIFKILHLRTALAVEPLGFLSFIFVVGLAAFLFISYKRNRYVFFSGLYLITLCGGIFAGIQANNKQDRLILIAIPFIFVVFIYGMYESGLKSTPLRFFFFSFLLVLLSINLYVSTTDAANKFTVLKKNMKGDIYYGYTQDWVNFLQMSAYCSDSLPPNSLVASRKPSMSFIFGKGKEFYGVFVAFSNDPDTILATFKREKVTHVIVASLRQNTKVNNGQVINTIHRLLYAVSQKYPQKFTFVKQIGEEEPATLYKINY